MKRDISQLTGNMALFLSNKERTTLYIMLLFLPSALYFLLTNQMAVFAFAFFFCIYIESLIFFQKKYYDFSQHFSFSQNIKKLLKEKRVNKDIPFYFTKTEQFFINKYTQNTIFKVSQLSNKIYLHITPLMRYFAYIALLSMEWIASMQRITPNQDDVKVFFITYFAFLLAEFFFYIQRKNYNFTYSDSFTKNINKLALHNKVIDDRESQTLYEYIISRKNFIYFIFFLLIIKFFI